MLPFVNDNVSFYNGYGPAECTVAISCYKITGNEPRNGFSLPIGRPLANARIYLLDEFLQQVIPGQIAELVIGGNLLSTSLSLLIRYSYLS